jgi:type IV pilus assembly protein PilO
MAMELRMPRTQREQAMSLLAIVGITGAVLYYMYVYSPKSAEMDTLAVRVDTLESNNQKAKAEIAKGTVEELQQQAQTYRENLELMRQLVPASHEVPGLLESVSNAARQAGLDIGQIEVLGVEQGQDFDAHKYKLTVNGPYHAVAEFLTNVGSLRRIVAPLNINMRAIGAQGARNRAAGPVPTVATTFELHTYVARTAPTAQGGQ